MRYAYLLFSGLLLPALPTPVLGHNALLADAPVAGGQLRGTVRLPDGQPADYVSVVLQGTTRGTTTDERGHFQLRNLAPGSYTLVVSFVGYAPQQVVVEVPAEGVVQVPAITLVRDPKALDEVTVTGRNPYHRANASNSLRLGEPLLEAAQNIQVVTSQLLADQQVFNSTEGITRNASGVQAPGHWNNVYARVSIRGFDTGFGSLRNGMSVANYFGPLLEDMSFVERIEFVKGPGGFLLGNTEAGGFYNVVLKAPTGTGRKAVGLTLGSFGTYRATADLDGKLSKDDRLQYRLNVMGQSLDSHQGYEFNRKVALAPSLRFKLDERTTLTAQYVYQYSNFAGAGNYVCSPYGYKSLPQDYSVYDPVMGSSRVNDHSFFFSGEHRFTDNWKLTGQLGYLRYAMRGLDNWIADGSFNGLNTDLTPGQAPVAGDSIGSRTLRRALYVFDVDNTTAVGQASLNGSVTTGAVRHRIIVGLDMSSKRYAAAFPQVGYAPQDVLHPSYYSQAYATAPSTLGDVESVRTQPLDQRGPYKGFARYAGLYVQDELGFFENRARLTLAARYSNSYDVVNRLRTNVVTPRLGLSVTVAPGTALYALYDQSYIPQTGADVNGNGFDPQRGKNTEVGLKRDWLDGRFSTTFTAFNITKTNVLTRDPSNPLFSIAVGEVRSRGLEFDFTGELLPGLNVVANYALIDPTVTRSNDGTQGQKFGGSSRHTTNTWLNYRFGSGVLKGFGLSGGMQWQAVRYPGFGAYGAAGSVLPDNYFRLDGGVSWQGEHLSLNLLVNNLTNRYNYAGAAYSAGYNYGGTRATRTGAYYYWQPEAPIGFRLNVGYTF